MAYNDTPLANESKNTSQPRIRNNFNVLQSFLALNHEDPDTGTGKHSFVTLPTHAVPATAAGEVALFSQVSTLSGLQELAIRRENNGVSYELTSSLNTENGWARLPSGLILKWGKQLVSISGNGVVVYPVAATIPVFTTVIHAQATVFYDLIPGNDVDAAIRITDFSNPLQLRVYGSHRFSAGANATTFCWLALGV
jgi:hypothetical protein